MSPWVQKSKWVAQTKSVKEKEHVTRGGLDIAIVTSELADYEGGELYFLRYLHWVVILPEVDEMVSGPAI